MNAHERINSTLQQRWRLIKKGGDDFVEEFLVRREKESTAVFQARQSMSYDPATASSAVDDVVNSLSARLDVSRTGGSTEYQDIIDGNNGGVDRNGASMDDFLISSTIPELCFMQKVCWVIHNFTDPNDERKVPYIVQHPVEQIFNWAYRDGRLTAFAVKFPASVIDEETGFAKEEVEVIRAFKLTESGVETWLQSEDDIELDVLTLEEGSSREVLGIDEIPVVVFNLPVGLLSKIDKIQIAALNLASADIQWLRTANLTIYTEQGTAFPRGAMVKSADPTTEEDTHEITLGSDTGRKYPMNAERPGFISPSAEPINASMKKQEVLDLKAKELLKTNMANMSLASAESIQLLGQGMESGLFIIGTVLKLGEEAFARIFHKYLNRESSPVTVSYPKKYELRTEQDRLNKVKEVKEISKTFGSNTAKKYLEIQAVNILLDGRIPHEELLAIHKEIQDTDFCIYEPTTVRDLVEAGIISRALASRSLGAPAEDAASAEAEHIRRIVAVKISQTSGMGDVDPDPAFSEKIRKEAAIEVPDA